MGCFNSKDRTASRAGSQTVSARQGTPSHSSGSLDKVLIMTGNPLFRSSMAQSINTPSSTRPSTSRATPGSVNPIPSTSMGTSGATTPRSYTAAVGPTPVRPPPSSLNAEICPRSLDERSVGRGQHLSGRMSGPTTTATSATSDSHRTAVSRYKVRADESDCLDEIAESHFMYPRKAGKEVFRSSPSRLSGGTATASSMPHQHEIPPNLAPIRTSSGRTAPLSMTPGSEGSGSSSRGRGQGATGGTSESGRQGGSARGFAPTTTSSSPICSSTDSGRSRREGSNQNLQDMVDEGIEDRIDMTLRF